MHSFVQKSITSVKTLNGRAKTKFSVTKGKDGVVHKLEGSHSSNNPNNLLIHESIRSLNNRTGKIHSANRVYKMKSSNIMNLLKESDRNKDPTNKKVITAQKKITSTLNENSKKIHPLKIKLEKNNESSKKVTKDKKSKSSKKTDNSKEKVTKSKSSKKTDNSKEKVKLSLQKKAQGKPIKKNIKMSVKKV